MSACIINNVYIKDNGTVLGITGNTIDNTSQDYPIYTGSTSGLTVLSEECCTGFSYTYNTGTTSCTWNPNPVQNYIKLMIDPSSGSTQFISTTGETYSLEVKFNYLLEFDAVDLSGLDNILTAFSGLSINASIELYSEKPKLPGVVYESPLDYQTMYSQNILNINTLGNYIANNSNTGIILVNDINRTKNNIINALGSDAIHVNNATFNSCWLTADFTISDNRLINLLNSNPIKLGIEISGIDVNFSVLLDNISMNQIWESVNSVDKTILKCPGFNLQRIIDNKKSWSKTSIPTNRNYILPQRETNYELFDSRLLINTKEIDLDIDPAYAIEGNVLSYIDNNNNILTGGTINFSELITTPLSGIISTNEFTSMLNSEIIDIKNRKVIQSYPTLRLLYDDYMNQSNSGKFVYNNLINYSKSIGTFWLDIIEQFIPSTTLWGSTYVYRNNIFDENKYPYKSYSLKFGSTNNNGMLSGYTGCTDIISSATSISDGIQVIITTIPFNGYSGNTATGSTLLINDINNNPEYIGFYSKTP
jgi:hypothetical protein